MGNKSHQTDAQGQSSAAKKRGITLERRLYAFFLLFLVTVMSGIALILFLTGALSAGERVSKVWLDNEISHLSADVSEEFGKISLDGIALAEKLGPYLEGSLEEQHMTLADLQENPALLTELLSGSYDYLAAALEKGRASGAFLMLDATVNPALPHAAHSRAGLYLKHMEPNVASAGSVGSAAFHFLRGPMSIAREKGITLLPQWKMEMKILEGDMFYTVTKTAREHNQALSRLYYWNPRFVLEGDYGQAIFLCLPLLTRDGTVLGICGLDISDQLFKIQYSPQSEDYPRVFALLAPVTAEGSLDAGGALFAGNYSVIPREMEGTLTVERGRTDTFSGDKGAVYTGISQELPLYPKDSAYARQKWALAVMMPQEDYVDFLAARNGMVIGLFAILFVLCLLAAMVLSRRYLSPIQKAFRMVKEPRGQAFAKTYIPEIDDLFEFLSRQDREHEEVRDGLSPAEPTSSAMYDAFVEKIATLSPAERAVFDLYLEGYDARQIADTLYLSINTIKTHNKRIYMKLDVTSRKELLVYAEMMKERGGAPRG